MIKNIDFIYENIVPTYEKYNFVDVSTTTAGSESIVVMGIGKEIGRFM